MAKTDTLHIRIEPKVKTKAESTLNDLGISITEAVNIFLHQVILSNGIPFEIKKPKFNKETLEAIEEAKALLKDKDAKTYYSMEKLMEDLNN